MIVPLTVDGLEKILVRQITDMAMENARLRMALEKIVAADPSLSRSARKMRAIARLALTVATP